MLAATQPPNRPNILQPITWDDYDLYQKFFRAESGSAIYANSWTYITQACRGLGLGWKYFDGDRLFSVGWHNGHYVMVNPLGPADDRLRNVLDELHRQSGKPVFIKKASDRHALMLRLAGAFAACQDSYAWDEGAYADDDSFPEQVIAIDISLGYSRRPAEWFQNYRAARNGGRAADERSVRASYRQFRRNLSRISESAVNCELLEYRPEMKNAVGVWVSEYFGTERPDASAAYGNLLESLARGVRRGFQFCFVIRTKSDCGMDGFIFAERLDDRSAAVYARLIRRTQPGLPEYAMAQVLARLQQQGICRLNLGGSETAGLHAFKQKLAPVEERKLPLWVYDRSH